MAETEEREQETEDRELSPGERAARRIERGNRRNAKREAEDGYIESVDGPRPGNTYESLDPREDDPRRRVKVLSVDGDQALVENTATLRHSHIKLDRLRQPWWKRAE